MQYFHSCCSQLLSSYPSLSVNPDFSTGAVVRVKLCQPAAPEQQWRATACPGQLQWLGLEANAAASGDAAGDSHDPGLCLAGERRRSVGKQQRLTIPPTRVTANLMQSISLLHRP